MKFIAVGDLSRGFPAHEAVARQEGRGMSLRLAIACVIILVAANCVAAAVTSAQQDPNRAMVLIQSPVEVDGPWIKLGDIAKIDGQPTELISTLKDIEIGRAALPGYTRIITLDSIKVRLRQARVDLGRVEVRAPDDITILTRAITVSGRDIAEEARRFVAETAAQPGVDVKVEISRIPGDLYLPVGQPNFQVKTTSTSKFPGRTTLMVAIFLDGVQCKLVPVSVDVRFIAPVVVASRTIQRYEVINPDMVRVEKQEIHNPNSLAASTVEDVLGKVASRTIPAGSVIERDIIANPPVISRGMRVTIVATRGSVTITASGEALEDGQVGQIIRVKNLDTARQVQAIVRDSSTVEVSL